MHLDFVVEPLGKGGADGAVHQPGGEGLLGGGPAFALEEAAGKLARRRHPLAIIAGQREEVDAPARPGPEAAAQSTTVSPYWTRQLPAACLANSPVSMEKTPAPICLSTRTFKVRSCLPSLKECGGGKRSSAVRHCRLADRDTWARWLEGLVEALPDPP